jgi:predicted enzyme related to lactoylglutathione lyase
MRSIVLICALVVPGAFAAGITAPVPPRAMTTGVAVAPQYDSTHVYVASADLESFVASFTATFGGHASAPVVSTVTPTPSSTQFQYIMSPVGMLSIFAYQTPVPYPFGLERTGYLVTDMDQALASARQAGASVVVEPFKDPIGLDAIIQWPGGVMMQLYWHVAAPSYAPLESIPEHRIYVARDRIDNFVNAFLHFSRGTLISDSWHANGAELGRPGSEYRRIRIDSKFGRMQVMANDGQLPYPFGYEITGYEVTDLKETLSKATAHGAKVLADPVESEGRRSAMLQFPGGYLAEVHSKIKE